MPLLLGLAVPAGLEAAGARRLKSGPVQVSGGKVELIVECQTGRSYDVEVSNNFQAWNLLTSFLSTNANMKVQDSPGGDARFYRVVTR